MYGNEENRMGERTSLATPTPRICHCKVSYAGILPAISEASVPEGVADISGPMSWVDGWVCIFDTSSVRGWYGHGTRGRGYIQRDSGYSHLGGYV